jgi:hypothetical protein
LKYFFHGGCLQISPVMAGAGPGFPTPAFCALRVGAAIFKIANTPSDFSFRMATRPLRPGAWSNIKWHFGKYA